jgi:hypothetical protein
VKVEKNPGLDAAPTPSSPPRPVRTCLPDGDDHNSLGALWKAQDFGDALYTFTAGAAALTARTQFKFEVLDSTPRVCRRRSSKQ